MIADILCGIIAVTRIIAGIPSGIIAVTRIIAGIPSGIIAVTRIIAGIPSGIIAGILTDFLLHFLNCGSAMYPKQTPTKTTTPTTTPKDGIKKIQRDYSRDRRRSDSGTHGSSTVGYTRPQLNPRNLRDSFQEALQIKKCKPSSKQESRQE